MTEPVLERLVIVGSASTHTWRYLAGIAPYAREVYLVTNGELPPAYRPANLAQTMTVDFRLLALGTARKLRRWLQAVAPQLIHVHQANSVAWHTQRAVHGLAIPLVLTAWGSDILLLPQKNWLMRHMVRSNLRAASLLTSDSRTMAARMRELAGDALSIELINYGVDALPAAPDWRLKEKRLLSCRLHKPLYRIEAIIRAWAVIEAEGLFPDWHLTVAASGPQTAELLELAKTLQLKRIDFPGFVSSDALAELYAKSRVFVSVPCSDATSISLLEAMGHGCLPLLSNLPANGEWVVDGLNGIIVEDIRHLADALLASMTLAADDRRMQAMAELNRSLVAQKALYAENRGRFASLYDKQLRKSGKLLK